MTIHERLQSDLKDAMRARDSMRTTTIRMVLAAIKNLQIEVGHPLDDSEVMQALLDSVEALGQAGGDPALTRRIAADARAQAAETLSHDWERRLLD